MVTQGVLWSKCSGSRNRNGNKESTLHPSSGLCLVCVYFLLFIFHFYLGSGTVPVILESRETNASSGEFLFFFFFLCFSFFYLVKIRREIVGL